jgi:hypothetical protein
VIYSLLKYKSRPPPTVTRTDPACQVRPFLPAGYGTGFEEGSMPIDEFLHMVRQL